MSGRFARARTNEITRLLPSFRDENFFFAGDSWSRVAPPTDTASSVAEHAAQLSKGHASACSCLLECSGLYVCILLVVLVSIFAFL